MTNGVRAFIYLALTGFCRLAVGWFFFAEWLFGWKTYQAQSVERCTIWEVTQVLVRRHAYMATEISSSIGYLAVAIALAFGDEIGQVCQPFILLQYFL